MKYIVWLWRGTRNARLNIAIRILVGVGRVALGLLTIWLSKRFIDETIRVGTDEDIVHMVSLLVASMVGSIVLRLVYYYMNGCAMVRKTNELRLFYFEKI